MKRPLMRIGQEFVHPSTGDTWRVTDVGTRTFLAIKVVGTHEVTRMRKGMTEITTTTEPITSKWLSGPPYADAEAVWDEYDQRALEDVPGIEWVER